VDLTAPVHPALSPVTFFISLFIPVPIKSSIIWHHFCLYQILSTTQPAKNFSNRSCCLIIWPIHHLSLRYPMKHIHFSIYAKTSTNIQLLAPKPEISDLSYPWWRHTSYLPGSRWHVPRYRSCELRVQQHQTVDCWVDTAKQQSRQHLQQHNHKQTTSIALSLWYPVTSNDMWYQVMCYTDLHHLAAVIYLIS